MKTIFIFMSVAACFAVVCSQYSRKYDHVDIDEVLANKRLLATYIKCILDQGKCTPEGKDLKSYISDALQTGCSKCTAKQLDGARRVISHLIKKEPASWTQLVDKYDPDRQFSTKYEKELSEVQN